MVPEMLYPRLLARLATVRKRLGRPLTLAEKLLFSHLDDPTGQELHPGSAKLRLRPDRVILQDAVAEMALLQFMQKEKRSVAVPTTLYCDHLIQAREGAERDLSRAIHMHGGVYAFLRAACQRYGIELREPGTGISHQLLLEEDAIPGGLVIGGTAHASTQGGLAMLGIGAGGADAVEAMAGFAWELKHPRLVGVRLTGALRGWASPKDVALRVAERLSVRGGTERIIEYFGPGVASLDAAGRATIANYSAETGATSAVFPFDERTEELLRATGREEVAREAWKHHGVLRADDETVLEPHRYFDFVIEIDLSELEAQVAGPFTPDLVRPVSKLALDARAHRYPMRISMAMLGSCGSSSYWDLWRAAYVARQARAAGARAAVPLLITPGSARVVETAARDGLIADLEAIGAQLMASACGPCIGHWRRPDIERGEPNTIITSYNRNFPGRHDDNPETYAFVASPELVVAFALAGSLATDPIRQELRSMKGRTYSLVPPPPPPPVTYAPPRSPARPAGRSELSIPRGKERQRVLEPFEESVEPELARMPVLLKILGPAGTEQIVPRRGLLGLRRGALFSGVINAWTGVHATRVPETAERLRRQGKRWVLIADENYGRGPWREEAASELHRLGAAVVVARSFDRVHENQLKRYGILPFVFTRASDYDLIEPGDVISFDCLHELDPVRKVNMLVAHADGATNIVPLRHGLNLEALAWFHAGSAEELERKKREGDSAGVG